MTWKISICYVLLSLHLSIYTGNFVEYLLIFGEIAVTMSLKSTTDSYRARRELENNKYNFAFDIYRFSYNLHAQLTSVTRSQKV